MTCNACGSEKLQLIKVFSGHNAMGWSPVAGEKDIFGNYKKLRPLLAHACKACGNVQWNIRVEQPQNTDETAKALVELAEEEREDPAEGSIAYSLDDELN